MRAIQLVARVAVLIAIAGQVQAGVIQYGLQSDVSQATLDSWGWTEIHRSPAGDSRSEAAIVAAATGDHLMMGVWDIAAQRYAILGAGETSKVTSITYADHVSDNAGNYNPNWSNGLNFYRTTTNGSWGFTTNTVTDLYSADIFLLNGLQASNGNVEAELSKGLSFHTWEGSFTAGWAYNVTGNSWQATHAGGFERVFFTTNADVPGTVAVPEPSSIAVFGIGACVAGVGIARRRRLDQQQVAIV